MGQLSVFLVLVAGPPAIGKTDFTSRFYHYALKNPSYKAIKIHYDDLIDARLESNLIDNNEWKSGRETVKQFVKMLIEFLAQTSVPTFEEFVDSKGSGSTNFWVQIRDRFIKSLPPDLSSPSENKYLILLDDIFYYESMRYQFYRMCLESVYECSFYSICLRTTNIDTLKDRNRSRPIENRVLETSIENIFGKFEYPRDWETRHSKVISTEDSLVDYESILSEVSEMHSFFRDMAEKYRSVGKEQRVDTNRNLAHESDLILRKLVSEKLSSISDRTQIGAIGKMLASRKTSLFAQVKDTQSDLHKSLAHLEDLQLIEYELRRRLFDDF